MMSQKTFMMFLMVVMLIAMSGVQCGEGHDHDDEKTGATQLHVGAAAVMTLAAFVTMAWMWGVTEKEWDIFISL